MPTSHLSFSNPNNNNNSHFYLFPFCPIFRHICAMQQQTHNNIPTFLCICCDYTIAFGLYSSGLVLWFFIHYPQYFVCGSVHSAVSFRSSFAALTLYTFIPGSDFVCIPIIYIYAYIFV